MIKKRKIKSSFNSEDVVLVAIYLLNEHCGGSISLGLIHELMRKVHDKYELGYKHSPEASYLIGVKKDLLDLQEKYLVQNIKLRSFYNFYKINSVGNKMAKQGMEKLPYGLVNFLETVMGEPFVIESMERKKSLEKRI